jgi:hypothetical protein
MGMPGFTAELSLTPTFTQYRGQYCHSLSADTISLEAGFVQPAVLLEIDGVPVGELIGVDEWNIYFEPVGGFPAGGGREPAGSRPPPGQRCYTCGDVLGQVSICCFADPRYYFFDVPECLQTLERIRDQCIANGGSREDCVRWGHCAACPCVAQRLGWEYCHCEGLV